MKKQDGFSLIELVITITVLTILTLGALPLYRNGSRAGSSATGRS